MHLVCFGFLCEIKRVRVFGWFKKIGPVWSVCAAGRPEELVECQLPDRDAFERCVVLFLALLHHFIALVTVPLAGREIISCELEL